MVEITYHSIQKDEITERIINPLGVYFSNTAWVLVGYCNKKKEYREFRLDRITDYKLTSNKFDNITDFNLTKYFY